MEVEGSFADLMGFFGGTQWNLLGFNGDLMGCNGIWW